VDSSYEKDYKKEKFIKIVLQMMENYPFLLRNITRGLIGCYGIPACVSSPTYDHNDNDIKKEKGRNSRMESSK
jgi:hypothetical protein